ncbi:MAG: Spy/CpxP family protein refolding chaperone [Campylobacterales bacterium]|nr:Spy/CpxP family protein refolding chaperone [Campylobacterales bacterium]MBN2833190.1 Spy/CpxP family protein refolding chaperone [Campylobacterales bacterium]
MKKSILTLATLVALGTTSAFAFGGGGCQPMQGNGMNYDRGMMHGGKGDGMMGMPMLMLDQLNLSDDQRHKLAILRSEMKLEMTKLRDPKMRTKMQDLMSAESFDKKAFIKMHNEMHEKMLALQADHMEKVFNVLSKEQRLELKKVMSERPVRAMQRMAPPAK